MTCPKCGFNDCGKPAEVERCTCCKTPTCIDHVIYNDNGEAFCPDCYPESESFYNVLGGWQ